MSSAVVLVMSSAVVLVMSSAVSLCRPLFRYVVRCFVMSSAVSLCRPLFRYVVRCFVMSSAVGYVARRLLCRPLFVVSSSVVNMSSAVFISVCCLHPSAVFIYHLSTHLARPFVFLRAKICASRCKLCKLKRGG